MQITMTELYQISMIVISIQRNCKGRTACRQRPFFAFIIRAPAPVCQLKTMHYFLSPFCLLLDAPFMIYFLAKCAII